MVCRMLSYESTANTCVRTDTSERAHQFLRVCYVKGFHKELIQKSREMFLPLFEESINDYLTGKIAYVQQKFLAKLTT